MDRSQDYVNTVLRDDKGKDHSLVLDCSEPDVFGGPRPCKAHEFKTFISERLALSNQVSCDEDYNPSGEKIKYADYDEYTERYLREIGLDNHPVHMDEGSGTSTIYDWIIDYEEPTIFSALKQWHSLQSSLPRSDHK